MGLFDKIKFNADGLIPAIIYDVEDNRPLTLCYMNREALEATINSGKVHVFRRSKGRLMLKGEQSGHVQEVVRRQVARDQGAAARCRLPPRIQVMLLQDIRPEDRRGPHRR